MDEMYIGGNCVRDNGPMQEAAKEFYCDLYSAEADVRPKLDHLQFHTLGHSEREGLEVAFTKDEIRSCLFDCNGNKAPGPNDFNMKFMQEFWLVLKDDIMDLFAEFHNSGKFVRSLN